MPLLHKLKDAYLLWFTYYQILPKTHRHSLGLRVDTLFVEAIEATATASFLKPEEKLPYVRLAMRKIDTIKIMLMVLWESDSLKDKQYIAISEKVSAIDKMMGGWQGQITKQNSPTNKKS
ncbi:MAG TPA: four helix bundle protein [Candidatus Paceibacterota bacterium]